jgi:ribonuclease HI
MYHPGSLPGGQEQLLYAHSHYLGLHDANGARITNNYAEYTGLVDGLAFILQVVKRADDRHVTVNIKGDSKLVIQQVQNLWKCQAPLLIPLWEDARNLLYEISVRLHSPSNIVFSHVPRKFNKEADRLANKAMDDGFSTTEEERYIGCDGLEGGGEGGEGGDGGEMGEEVVREGRGGGVGGDDIEPPPLKKGKVKVKESCEI